jgi:uncharacterized protein (UPF0218 family)
MRTGRRSSASMFSMGVAPATGSRPAAVGKKETWHEYKGPGNLPQLDMSLTSLLTDLEERGRLDTTLVVAKSGCEPHLAIVDFKTRRHQQLSADERQALARICADRVLRVRNPAGGITRELWDAVASTAEQRMRTRIEVDGEEDLATLAVLALCPDDSQVLYGQPGEGLVHLSLGPELRQRARTFLDRMKEN